MKRRPGRLLAVAICFAALLFTAFSSGAQTTAASIRRLEDLSQAFRHAYEQVRPAVVLISTTRSWNQSLLPTWHKEVPEDDFRGMGSGTVISGDGYILSNYHVIAGADSILVTLSDRRTFHAEIVGFEQGGATPAVLDEMATQLSCRLDAIDVGDSATLRELRRAQLRRCEQLCSKL